MVGGVNMNKFFCVYHLAASGTARDFARLTRDVTKSLSSTAHAPARITSSSNVSPALI